MTLREAVDAWVPIHSDACAAQDDEDDCICGTSAVYEALLAHSCYDPHGKLDTTDHANCLDSECGAAWLIRREDQWRQRVIDAEGHSCYETLAADAASSMRVPVEDIKAALHNLRGPVTRDESIVMACAQAVVWAMEARSALEAGKPR